ncbi:MAG: response regulator, partial [Candidatus Riflebacteria bacterium]|nr:response regulator [Candidatus Riflebacteria bacterium]
RRLVEILTAGGYEVLVADDGLTGFQVAVKQRPDMIISDIQMPTLDGISFCKALKDHASVRSTPVVFMSDLDSMDDLVKGLEAGASDYLSKKSDGPEQVLAMAEVHTVYSQKLKATRSPGPEPAPEKPPTGEEFQAVHDLPANFFDGLSFGLIIVNLRRQPIYANSTARGYLGFSLDAPVALLGGEVLQQMLTACAKAYPGPGEFFYTVQFQGLSMEVHLEQVYSIRKEICGAMLLLRA